VGGINLLGDEDIRKPLKGYMGSGCRIRMKANDTPIWFILYRV